MHRIDSVKPCSEDKVILNGGEPTIHPSFYSMVNYVNENYFTNLVVYTNGVSLDLSRIKNKDNIMFIVPIHGERALHNSITRNKESFSSTIKNLQDIQKNGIRFTIKFIINAAMVDDNFDFSTFLNKYNLSPDEIIIARLNETKKSKANKVVIVDTIAFIDYLNFYDSTLRQKYVLKYLDIPFCFLIDLDVENLEIMNVPQFYFNDYEHKMFHHNYYKQIRIGENCEECGYSLLCNKLSNSYLTICFRGGWRMEVE
jgi:sulfatase maturation enzyme AslB (radical SAM superfamily)